MALYDSSGNRITTSGSSSVITSPCFSANPYDATFRNVNHRGYRVDGAKENTIQAYKDSKKHGWYYVETDVQFTSDGIPVLFHDYADNNLPITTTSYADLIAVDSDLAKFEDFIILCKNIGLHPYIEIKNNQTDTQTKQLVDFVKSYCMERDVTWIGNVSNLKKVTSNDAKARVGVVNLAESSLSTALQLKTGQNEVFLDQYLDNNCSDTLVAYCKTNGLGLEVYTWGNLAYCKENIKPYVTGLTHDTVMLTKDYCSGYGII